MSSANPDRPRRLRRPRVVRRRVERFLTEPATVRNAVAAIVAVMVASVLLGGVVVWIFDPYDFPRFGLGLWWALQTVTTVGYGDITPTTWLGRAVGAVIMLESIAFVSITTALITSSFVDRAMRERTYAADDPLTDALDEVAARLAVIEEALGIQYVDEPDAEPTEDGSG